MNCKCLLTVATFVVLWIPQGVQAAMIGYWPMDGNANNQVPGGPTLTVESGVTFAGPANAIIGTGSATGFSANNGLAVTNASDNAYLDNLIETGSYTIAVWAQSNLAPNSFSQNKTVFEFGQNAANSLTFGIQPSGSVFYYMNTASPFSYEIVNTPLFDDSSNATWGQNQWHHYALTYDNSESTLRFYFDGQLKHTSVIGPPNINSSTNHASTANGPFSFGVQSKHDNTAGRFFEGYLDDAVLYNQVFDEEIIAAWASGQTASTLPPIPEPSTSTLIGLACLLSCLAKRGGRSRG